MGTYYFDGTAGLTGYNPYVDDWEVGQPYRFTVSVTNRRAHTVHVTVRASIRMWEESNYFSFWVDARVSCQGKTNQVPIKHEGDWAPWSYDFFWWGNDWHTVVVFDADVALEYTESSLPIKLELCRPNTGGISIQQKMDEYGWWSMSDDSNQHAWSHDNVWGGYPDYDAGMGRARNEVIDIGPYPYLAAPSRRYISPSSYDVGKQGTDNITVSWRSVAKASYYKGVLEKPNGIIYLDRVPITAKNSNMLSYAFNLHREYGDWFEEGDRFRFGIASVDQYGVCQDNSYLYTPYLTYTETLPSSPRNLTGYGRKTEWNPSSINEVVCSGEQMTFKWASPSTAGSYPISEYRIGVGAESIPTGELRDWAQFSVGGETYMLRSAVNNLYMDVQDGKTANLTNIRCWYGNKTSAQQFVLKSTGVAGEFYILSALNRKKAVEDYGDNDVNFANVSLYDFNGSASQKWMFVPLGYGQYKIKHSTGRCLDVSYGTLYNGANIALYDDNGSDTQKWYLESYGSAGFTYYAPYDTFTPLISDGYEHTTGDGVHFGYPSAGKVDGYRLPDLKSDITLPAYDGMVRYRRYYKGQPVWSLAAGAISASENEATLTIPRGMPRTAVDIVLGAYNNRHELMSSAVCTCVYYGGIMYVYADGIWHEGIANVQANGTEHEAVEVDVYENGVWRTL